MPFSSVQGLGAVEAVASRGSTDDSIVTSADELWASARQWRSIVSAESKAVTHGQMLVSLQMDVPLLNPRFLHAVVKVRCPVWCGAQR